MPPEEPGDPDEVWLRALRVIYYRSASDPRDAVLLESIERIIAEADRFLASSHDMPGRVREVRFCREQLAKLFESGDMRVTSDIYMYGVRIHAAIDETRQQQQRIADEIAAHEAARTQPAHAGNRAKPQRLADEIAALYPDVDVKLPPDTQIRERLNVQRRRAGLPEVSYDMVDRAVDILRSRRRE